MRRRRTRIMMIIINMTHIVSLATTMQRSTEGVAVEGGRS